MIMFAAVPGTGAFDYGHTLDADTIRISTIVQAGIDIDETGVRILMLHILKTSIFSLVLQRLI